MANFSFGALAGGLADGISHGREMMRKDDQAAREQEAHAVRMEQAKLGLEHARNASAEQQRGRDYRAGREKLIQDLTTMPTMPEGAKGGYPEGVSGSRQMALSDLARLHEELALYDFRHGRMDQATFMAMPRRIRVAQEEGLFDAYTYALQNPEDTSGIAERFNAVGRTRIDPASIRLEERRDRITGATYKVIRSQTTDGREGIFDPVEMAQFAGGAKGFLEFQDKQAQRASEARRASAAETQAQAADRRAGALERRADAAERTAESRARRDDAMVEVARQREGRLGSQTEGGRLTLPQMNRNLEISAARKRLAGMSADEVRRRTAKTTNTGRENPDYDPLLERSVRLAHTRQYGGDDDFDAGRWGGGQSDGSADVVRSHLGSPGASVEDRFKADPGMKAYRLGQQTPRGREVFDARGKLVGHYN